MPQENFFGEGCPMKNLLKMLARVRIFTGPEMAAFKFLLVIKKLYPCIKSRSDKGQYLGQLPRGHWKETVT